MNPRLFCRARAYHKALLLTYSFDPIFFEQVVLPDLWAGRSSDILVLGDSGEIDAAFQSAAGQLLNLGKQYLLAGAAAAGAFHPKLFVRLGPNDGIVMVGSGNVTSSGWGGNQELGTAWRVGPDHTDNGGWLHPLFDDVLTWCQGDLERDAVRRFRDVPWLSLTPATPRESGPVLRSRGAQSLAAELTRRWSGRRFDTVKILTGSTDESGTFLRWAQATFGITRATIALTPASASFVADRLADLPLEVRLIEAPPERPLHAKFYWFEGAEGSAAVMGSANCSAAAWLLAPESGGNVESVMVYDQPHAQDFASALRLFALPGRAPADILVPRIRHDPALAARPAPFAIRRLHWDSGSRQLIAAIVPAPGHDARVDLQLGERVVPMVRMPGPEALWVGEIADGLDASTMHAAATVTLGQQVWTTGARWIDDLAALQHASHSARLLEPFKSLDRAATSAEQRQMLDELQEVAQTLFNDPASFRDPGFGGEASRTKHGAPVQPVNPNDLLVSFEELHERPLSLASAHPGYLSLTGILRLLFEAEAQEDRVPAAAGDEEIDEGQPPEAAPPLLPDGEKPPDGAATGGAAIEARFRERLAVQINTFLMELSSTAFAGRCTATQMVQAVAFPLAVALRGRRQGWVSDALAEKWALEVFSILFRGHGSGARGLLRAVEQRYVDTGQKDTFDGVAGDGTLWLVLVATLGGAHWQGLGTDIDKAVALREVFCAPQLLAAATPGRVASLLGKLRIEGAQAYVANVAPRVTQLLNAIECALRPGWVSQAREQGARAIIHRPGDLLWRDKVGWAVCLEEVQDRADRPIKVRLKGLEKAVMPGFYVNVSELSRRDAEISQLVEVLRTAVAAEDLDDASDADRSGSRLSVLLR